MWVEKLLEIISAPKGQQEESGSLGILKGSNIWTQLGNSRSDCKHKPFCAFLLLFALAERHWRPNEIQQRINHKSVGHDMRVKCVFSCSQCIFVPVVRDWVSVLRLHESIERDKIFIHMKSGEMPLRTKLSVTTGTLVLH